MSVIQSIEEGRKEDGNRSIADKIIKRLHDLDKTVENNQGRWAWELLQNAKDSIAEDDRTVSVQIELDDNSVEFRHNGTHFTEQDIRGLINQISSKEVEEGQATKKTGKFGTGFLTTHLLSRVIHVKGIVETQSGDFYRFEFPLDRDGKTTAQLVPKIENAWTQFHESATLLDTEYDQEDYNTSFKYNLNSKEQKEIAQLGIEEFLRLIPFVLAFNPKISRIEVIDNTDFNATTFERKQSNDDDHIVLINRKDYTEVEDLYILSASDDKVAVATKLKKTATGYSVKSLKDVPKIFCDFPLIGTENFHFPVIVNSFFFNPLTERDGIWLKKDDDPEVEENQELFEKAVELYKQLIDKVSSENFFNLYNIVDTRMPVVSDKYLDEAWYKRSVQTPLREFIFQASLVELEAVDAAKVPLKDIWFPLKSYSEKVREGIWQFTYDQFDSAVCKKEHLHKWCNLFWDAWNKLDYREIVSDISKHETVEVLSKAIGRNTVNTFNWLNSLYAFVFEDESNLSLGENFAIIPNRNEQFKKKSDLRIDKIKDDDLVDILELLGEDWKDILIHSKVSFGRYVVKEKKDIANRITEILKNPKSKDENYISAISLLSEWFENNREDGKDLFSELYRKRAELFMNTIQDKESLYKVMRSSVELSKLAKVAKSIEENPSIIDNYEKAEELNSLLKEYNVSNVEELKQMLKVARAAIVNNAKVEITQETLVSLGVTSIEELEEALRDKDIAAHFTHSSTPRVEAFLYVQTLIKRSKENIIEHLRTLEEYDCDEMEELATTVIGGIKKEGLPIHVVIRPSDNGEVIVYYSSEKDTLDYANAELWIDNGKDIPRHLTLGKILKTTGINRIPV